MEKQRFHTVLREPASSAGAATALCSALVLFQWLDALCGARKAAVALKSQKCPSCELAL